MTVTDGADTPHIGRADPNHFRRFARIPSFASLTPPIQTFAAKKILMKWISTRRMRRARELAWLRAGMKYAIPRRQRVWNAKKACFIGLF
jgi:hypothetical protein